MGYYSTVANLGTVSFSVKDHDDFYNSIVPCSVCAEMVVHDAVSVYEAFSVHDNSCTVSYNYCDNSVVGVMLLTAAVNDNTAVNTKAEYTCETQLTATSSGIKTFIVVSGDDTRGDMYFNAAMCGCERFIVDLLVCNSRFVYSLMSFESIDTVVEYQRFDVRSSGDLLVQQCPFRHSVVMCLSNFGITYTSPDVFDYYDYYDQIVSNISLVDTNVSIPPITFALRLPGGLALHF